MEDKINITLKDEDILDIDLQNEETFNVTLANDAIVATNKNYNNLINKPQINNVTLEGNKTAEEFNIPDSEVTNLEIDNLF